MAQVKTKRTWRPGPVERRVREVARQTAEHEAARIPWSRLQGARKKYIEWEAFALWVRAIEETEGNFPPWLVEVVNRRCNGFTRFVAEEKVSQSCESPLLWRRLVCWIKEHIFGKIWRENWMNAVGFYAARDLTSLRNHAYWEYCDHHWKRSKPAVYPSFPDWLRASEHCSDRVLDECEMPEEKRRLIKLSRRVGARTLRNAVERYVEWEVFAYWARAALEADSPMPALVEREMNRRCQGFLRADTAARAANPAEEPHCRFNRMIKWIEDHDFTHVKKRGWFDVLLYQTRLHARHARVIDYWHACEVRCTKDPSTAYLSFTQWQRAADSYTFELSDR
jgi:hypothetical protein